MNSQLTEAVVNNRINQAHQLHLSKIEANRRTLRNLVSKRLRLDIEIQNLTRALKKQTSTKTTSKRLLKEAGIEMESSDIEQDLEGNPGWQTIVSQVSEEIGKARDLLILSDEQFLL